MERGPFLKLPLQFNCPGRGRRRILLKVDDDDDDDDDDDGSGLASFNALVIIGPLTTKYRGNTPPFNGFLSPRKFFPSSFFLSLSLSLSLSSSFAAFS